MFTLAWIFLFNSTFNFFRNMVVVEFELWALDLLGWCSTTWLTPLALFNFSYFTGRVFHFCPGPASDHDHVAYNTPSGWERRHAHHIWLIDWDWVSWTFYLGCPQTIIVPISTSLVAGTTNVSHCSQLALHLIGIKIVFLWKIKL
jgi:hypothetical protein